MPTYKIAIVGAGPAGYFTAQAFQKAQSDDRSFAIDMIERLPTPWGLVRSGVAPDHPKIKTVSKVFEKIAKEPNFRLFANVELGKDVSLKDLRDQYDVVVLATGASKGRKLGIPGEELKNSLSAAEFVPWYNAHPDYVDVEVDLSSDTAVVIGAGNVAMDVARILAIDPSELDSTDVAEHALIKLKQSNIRTVIICGRRGPEHAAFTAPELRDLPKLENTDVFIDPKQITEAIKHIEEMDDVEKDLKNNIEAMKTIAEHEKKGVPRKLEIKFLSTPLEIKGSGKVEEIVFQKNKVKNGKVVATGETFSVKTGLVITAIGYNSIEYPGISIENGQITNIAGHVEHNVYAVGWAKRGPTGVIGTNKSDSNDVVDLIIENLKEPKTSEGITGLLKSGHEVIDQIAWEKINASEVISGEIAGKPRVKEVDWKQLISLGRS
ncbi:ferredoxin--NADP+ reductase [Candidatus Nanopelagicus hibericus]|uniref:ferredoxin--NADP(+) reductase n=1 Tax=Candidatus Nanopelagicus hibericus TaxID=1884915 RepID=A0A249KAN6_9ACTN|nr:FAD-dependent oxidoreductase [Candidatus Nanopelagicus hibericus]ASY13847.1 ferredoxin--NADP+ reductase [Candidatus Nanopelagicus hibericus]